MKAKDADMYKGAIEDEPYGHSLPGESQYRMSSQLAHRDSDDDVKDYDSDFPEPGRNPEHS